MIYVFDGAYLFNKHQIEVSSGFDRTRYFNRLYDELTAEGCHFRRDFHLDDYWVEEGYCLYEEGEFWVVAYIERGKRLSPAFFVHPQDAELFFRAKLRDTLLENRGEQWLPPLGWRPK